MGFCFNDTLNAQQSCLHDTRLSERIANYTMNVTLDHETKTASGNQVIVWHNTSPDTVKELRFYMYLNAFKNNKTSYLRDLDGLFFGQNLFDRAEEEWGWIELHSIIQSGKELISSLRFERDIDGNMDDESVVSVQLDQVVMPGDSVVLFTQFTSKMPRTLVRSGYSKDDFFHFVHWYPKLGVYEKNSKGVWAWNCHQFLRQMEFYGDFGTYDITLSTSDHLKIGATGCLMSEERIEGGLIKRRYLGLDVIDFAWTVSPCFEEYIEKYKHITLKLLIPPEHRDMKERILHSATGAFAYLEERLGRYPYNQLTIIDPPVHALNSGFMEYPQLITGGSFYGIPKGYHGVESLIIHELAHQFFMGILANNEKEEPWLDEGIVSFYEDRITDHLFGARQSFVDLLGYKVGNSALSRNEYTSQSNLRSDAISTKSWEIKGSYKRTVYSKAATVLRTLMGYMGEERFDEMMKEYYRQHAFTHPRKEDFYAIVTSWASNHDCLICPTISAFLHQAIDGTEVCDYAVTNIRHTVDHHPTGIFGRGDGKAFVPHDHSKDVGEILSTIRLERKGSMILPSTVRITWEDGSEEDFIWDGRQTIEDINFRNRRKIVSAYLDPEHLLTLDIDFNNNSFTLTPKKDALLKYAERTIFWVQNILQASSFLM